LSQTFARRRGTRRSRERSNRLAVKIKNDIPLIVEAARWGAAAVLLASAAWIAAAPRADQPLIDRIESMYPAMRALYMDEAALALAADAESYQARYRVEAQKERARAAAGGASDATPDETRRIAAVLDSYGDMIERQRAVVREVTARSRERRRWWIALVLALTSLGASPWRPWRRTTG